MSGHLALVPQGGAARSLRSYAALGDGAAMLVLLLLTVALRAPYLTSVPYAWDSVLYLRALDHFDARLHQPQPPGYLFYVASARLLRLLAHDPNRALVWLSALASGLAVAALYLLGRMLYGRTTGLIAALFLATSTTFWFYGEVAYPYTTLAAGSIVLALLALALRRGLLPGTRGAALAALVFGLLTGFRQDLALFLAPLFLAAFWGRPPRDWLAALGAGMLGVLAWFVPTAALSGGASGYLQATFRQAGNTGAATSVVTGGLHALRVNTSDLAIFLWRGLYLALAPLLYVLGRWLVAPRRADPGRWWLLLWLAPPLLVYTQGHIGDYGYTFSLLPGLLLLAARGVVLGARDVAALAGAVAPRGRAAAWSLAPLVAAAVLVAGNGELFVQHHAQLSVAGLRCFDTTMRARVELTRRHFPPGQTLIFASAYYQQVRYLLPEYPVWFYDPSTGQAAAQPIAPGTRYLLIFDEIIQPAGAGFQQLSLPCNGTPYFYAVVRPGDVARFDGARNTVAVARAPGAASGTAAPLDAVRSSE